MTRFRPAAVKAIIHDVLNEELSGKRYSSEEATSWSKHTSETVKEKLKGKVPRRATCCLLNCCIITWLWRSIYAINHVCELQTEEANQ